MEVEGKHAIDSPGMPKSAEVPPEEYLLEENEERSMIEPKSYDNPKLKNLISILIEWVNDELHSERIIVQDIEEDLYDGQVTLVPLPCLKPSPPDPAETAGKADWGEADGAGSHPVRGGPAEQAQVR